MRFFIATLALSLGAGVCMAQVVPMPLAKPPAGVTAKEGIAARKAEDAKAIADCLRNWEPATHMTRRAWARTCRRVQERFRRLDLQ